MINGTQITVVGNVGGDPELRFTPSGAAVATFSVAHTPRRFDKTANKWIDGTATWYRINAWRALGENIAETVTRGQRVIVVGTIAARDWVNEKTGEKGTSWEVTADAVGPDLTWATAKVTRAKRDGTPMPEDPWGSSAPAEGDSGGWGSHSAPNQSAEAPF
jgi:single-strand DNA-binding protein